MACGWMVLDSNNDLKSAHVLILFGDRRLLSDSGQSPLREKMREFSASSIVVGCSTAGEIAGGAVRDGSIVLAAVEFDSTQCRAASAKVARDTSRAAGRSLAKALSARDLLHVFVLSEGLDVNGSEPVAGFREELPPGVQVTGGLSGDGADFRKTGVWWDGALHSNLAVAAGF